MPRTVPLSKYSHLTDVKHLGPYFRGEMVSKHKIHTVGELYRDLCSKGTPIDLQARVEQLARNKQAGEILAAGKVHPFNKKLAWSLYRLMLAAAGRPEFDGYSPRVDVGVIEHLQSELMEV